MTSRNVFLVLQSFFDEKCRKKIKICAKKSKKNISQKFSMESLEKMEILPRKKANVQKIIFPKLFNEKSQKKNLRKKNSKTFSIKNLEKRKNFEKIIFLKTFAITPAPSPLIKRSDKRKRHQISLNY